MDRLLFVGGMFPKDSKKIIEYSKGNVQNAANVLQWGIIRGIIESKKFDVTLCSAVFVGSWFRLFRKLFVKNFEESDKIDYIPFLNLPVIKNISRYFTVKRYVKKWVKKYKADKLYIIAYSAHTPFIKAISKIKIKNKFNFHLIVPDLPQYMNLTTKTSLIYNVFKKIDINIQNKYLINVDSFTFLTDMMSKKYNIYNRPYTVVEGMIDTENMVNIHDLSKIKTLVYTGTLEEKYGILNLVNAMEYVKSDIKLIVCGAGSAAYKIKEKAYLTNKIDYRGILSYNESIRVQASATVLVNPRPNNEKYTKYSFPSKNLEYMMWNKPVMAYKLDGIPDEYDAVLIYFSSDNPIDMAKLIDYVFQKTDEELLEIGKKTTNFAINNKNYKRQTEKIIDCICSKTV